MRNPKGWRIDTLSQPFGTLAGRSRYVYKIYTLPETNSSHLTIDHPKRKLAFFSNHPFENGRKCEFRGGYLRKPSHLAIFVPPPLRLKELTGDTGSSGLGTAPYACMQVKWGPEKRVISGVTMGPPNLHSKKSPTGPTERTPKPE